MWFQIQSNANPGYTAKEVKALLARVGAGKEGEGGSRLKRVVMLSSVGVNRRDDMMLKLRQMHANLDERVRFIVGRSVDGGVRRHHSMDPPVRPITRPRTHDDGRMPSTQTNDRTNRHNKHSTPPRPR